MKAALLALTLLIGAGAPAGATTSALVPGDRIGSMRVTRHAWSEHMVSIFPACDPLITRPGFYHRSCIVPRFHALFIGYGDFRTTLPELDRAWRAEQWQLYVDGHEVYLPAFGTDWRIIPGFGGAVNRNTVFREWQVALVGPARGRHTIRYIAIRRDGVVDVTFTVRVA